MGGVEHSRRYAPPFAHDSVGGPTPTGFGIRARSGDCFRCVGCYHVWWFTVAMPVVEAGIVSLIFGRLVLVRVVELTS